MILETIGKSKNGLKFLGFFLVGFYEFAKLRVLRAFAPYMPLRLRAFVSYMPSCLHAFVHYAPSHFMCLTHVLYLHTLHALFVRVKTVLG